jgi:carboxymethylenebutenolidase
LSAAYLALAANLYSRQGDASVYPTIQALNDQLVSEVSDAQVWFRSHGVA